MDKCQIEDWEVLSRKVLEKNHIFELAVEHARCSDADAEGDFFVFKYGDWVNIAALTCDGELVMIQQYRHGSKQVEWEIPGGLIDPEDAGPIAAGERELLEETGFAGKDARIIGRVCPNPALQGNFCYTLLVTDARRVQEPDLELCEDIATSLVPLNKVAKMIDQGQITHGLVLNALHWLERQNGL